MKIFFFESHVLNNRNSLTYLWLLRDLNTLSDTCKYDCFFRIFLMGTGRSNLGPWWKRWTGTAYTKAQPSGSFCGILRICCVFSQRSSAKPSLVLQIANQ